MVYFYCKVGNYMKLKSKFKFVLIVLILCFICTGCTGNTTRGIRHAGFTLSATEFTCNLLLPSDKSSVYDKLKYVNSTKAITSDGKVYELSLGQKFSNEQNCMEADFNKRVVAILDSNIIKADDNNFYYLSSENNVEAYTMVTVNDKSYNIYEILFSDSEVIRIVTVDGNAGIYYALKSDGNIYKLIITRSSSQEPYSLTSSEIVYSKGRYGKIVDFNYDINNTTTFIRTDDAIFRMLKVNEKECSKYADIECKYEMSEDTQLFKYNNYILGFNGQLLISSYGKVFNVS